MHWKTKEFDSLYCNSHLTVIVLNRTCKIYKVCLYKKVHIFNGYTLMSEHMCMHIHITTREVSELNYQLVYVIE